MDKQNFYQVANLNRNTENNLLVDLLVLFARLSLTPIVAALPLMCSTPLKIIDQKNSISSTSLIKKELDLRKEYPNKAHTATH